MRAVIATLFLSVHLATAGENWPRFRGPMGAGEAPPSVVLPDDWSPEATRWTSQLAGTGHSSPVIWEGKIFVTSAIDRGRQRILQCFDLQEGSELWRVQVASAGHKRHRFNSFATSTPAVDAMNVYLLWGQPDQIQVVAYSHDGELRWNKNLGAYKSGHGFGVSPIAVGGKLIIANDQEAANSIVALDTKMGKVTWSAERHPKRATYSTPIIFPHDDGSTDVIVSDWQQGISALDLATGEQRWTKSVFDTDDKQRAIGSPIVWDDLIIATCGFAAGKRRLVAIKAGEKPALAFQLDDFVPHVPT
ncbi:MAG: PQQ-binding-like beta-propeller repeat protein, partial [Verrucomicrobiales bacterium]